MTQAQEPILLGGYAAKQCPVRVQNDYLPLVPTLKWEPSPEDQARLEVSVFEDLAVIHPAVVVVDSGAPLILGGWLPDDVEGGRTGKPDILLMVDGGYLPADVKNHLTVLTVCPRASGRRRGHR